MSLRRRLSYVAAAAVAIAILLAALVCYWVVRDQLRGQVDDALRAQATAVLNVGNTALNQQLPGIPPSMGGPAQYYQVVGTTGNWMYGDFRLPIDAQVRSIASGRSGSYLGDVRVGQSHLRVLTFPATGRDELGNLQPVAVQLARPLNGIDHVLANLRLILLLLCAFGIALAAILGRLAARRVLAPLAEVAETAQHISETEDLTSRIHVHADDEVGQLATRFNAMIERLQGSREELDESVRAQRQLVADASHELRTPITSLRTNIEVLLDQHRLDEADRRRLLADVVEQTEELSALIGDLIELARGDLPADLNEDVRLDRVLEESLNRARRNHPGIRFEASLTPVIVQGVPERLGRVANNLLDNAARHSGSDGLVEVTVDRDGLRVRDHGTGIDETDLPYVFDRFYRGANSRGRQGTGLGLAIVRQVAIQHGGDVFAANAPDGGAVFTITLPVEAAQDLPDELLRAPAGERGAPVWPS
jgi:two-component system, OmpR family, sensor histidine kinase MprB